jgi:uncharacterized protein (DUF427 family)
MGAGAGAHAVREGACRMTGRIPPQRGQESAWDYPRPPRVEKTGRHVVVMFGGLAVADTHSAVRLLEKTNPPVYYIPPQHVRLELMTLNRHHTQSEVLGAASYYDLSLDGRVARNAAWVYTDPLPGYEDIRGRIAFFAGRIDEALVDGERAVPQPGGFGRGWITSDVVGPFKGEPGSWDW